MPRNYVGTSIIYKYKRVTTCTALGSLLDHEYKQIDTKYTPQMRKRTTAGEPARIRAQHSAIDARKHNLSTPKGAHTAKN